MTAPPTHHDDATVGDSDEAPGGQLPPLSEAISQLLDRHSVPSRQKLRTLADVLDIGYSQLRRRWVGQLAWSLDDLARIADEYREPLAELLCAYQDGPGEPAMVQFEDVSIIGTLWRGREMDDDGRIGPLVATPRGSNDPPYPAWKIIPIDQAGEAPVFAIRRFVLEPPRVPRIAIVDDDEELANTIAAFFRAKGMPAVAFSSLEAFQATNRERPFSAFIFDWVVGDRTAEASLQELRQRDRHSPIIVLTGKGNPAFDTSQSKVSQAHSIFFMEKPTRCAYLFSTMSLLLQKANGSTRSPD
ncbi:MAG TPA: helix-turn-helix domain-containing protein [Burkholderiaceae bacterium]|nr:helix-turn-helix domain-containing protein [Burkholderiaceae bacterium]